MIKKISIFIFSFLVFACYGQKKLSFDEFSSLNDSLDNQISLFFTLFLDSYELAYLEYPSDFDDFIEFYYLYDEKTFSHIDKIIEDNLGSFALYVENNKLEFSYNDTVFMIVEEGIDAQYITEYITYNKKVIFYRNNKLIEYDEERDYLFRKDFNDLLNNYIRLSDNDSILDNQSRHFFEFDKDVILLLQIDLNKGINIHDLHKNEYQIYRNKYYDDLEKICVQYCKKYNCDKIIFPSFYNKPKN